MGSEHGQVMGVEIEPECVMLKDSIRFELTAGAVEEEGPSPLTVWVPHSIS